MDVGGAKKHNSIGLGWGREKGQCDTQVDGKAEEWEVKGGNKGRRCTHGYNAEGGRKRRGGEGVWWGD